MRCGVRDNLDGIYSIVPELAASIVEAAEAGDYPLAAQYQSKLTEFLLVVAVRYPLFPACTAILNSRGVPGKVHQIPMPSLEPAEVDRLLSEPEVRSLLGTRTTSISA